jgi:hypothetical protein
MTPFKAIMVGVFIGSGFFTSPHGARAGTAGFDPAQKAASVTLSNGNRRATISGNNLTGRVYTTSGKNAGKFYAEFTLVSETSAGGNVSPRFGIAPAGASLTSSVGVGATEWAYSRRSDGAGIVSNNNATVLATYAAPVAGDVIGIAVDLTASKIWFARNNVWQGAGADPATGANPTATISAATTYFPCVSMQISGTRTGVIDSPASQAFVPPAGFSPWS